MNTLSPLRAKPARLPMGRGWIWVRSGFDIFNKGMGVSVAMVLIWFGVGLLLEQLPGGNLLSQLIYMVWGAGWVVVAQRGYDGQPLRLADFFAGFRHQLSPLMLGGVLVLVLFNLVGVSCQLLLARWGLTSLLSQDPATLVISPAQAQGLILTLLLGLALMIPLLMAITFAPALIFFHRLRLWQAIRLSFQGCLINMWPFFWWGLLGALLMVLGSVLMLVGLLVVIPALNYSLYLAYRDIYLDLSADGGEGHTPDEWGGFEA